LGDWLWNWLMTDGAKMFANFVSGLIGDLKELLSPANLWAIVTGSEPTPPEMPAKVEAVAYDASGNRVVPNVQNAGSLVAGAGGGGGTNMTTVVNNTTTLASGGGATVMMPTPTSNTNDTYRRATSANYQ